MNEQQAALMKRYAEWKAFTDALQTVVEEKEPGRFTYFFSHLKLGEDKSERGWFPTREAALASAAAVIALKWPEPRVKV